MENCQQTKLRAHILRDTVEKHHFLALKILMGWGMEIWCGWIKTIATSDAEFHDIRLTDLWERSLIDFTQTINSNFHSTHYYHTPLLFHLKFGDVLPGLDWWCYGLPDWRPLLKWTCKIRPLSGTSSFSNDTVRFTAVSAYAYYSGNFGIKIIRKP